VPTSSGASSPPPGRPPQLLLRPDQARKIIKGLLDDGLRLDRSLPNVAVFSWKLEEFEANCSGWASRAYEILRRMWDQDSYATVFESKGNYGPSSPYEMEDVRIARGRKALRDQINDLRSQLDMIDIAASAPVPHATPPPTPERSSPYVVVHGGTGVSIGRRVRDISITVHAITGPSAEEVKRLTTTFAGALAAAYELPEEEREEGLEQLKFVADVAANPRRHRPAILRPIVDRLGIVAKGSAALHSIYEQWAPAINNLIQHQQHLS
jgi:hypothetical protein